MANAPETLLHRWFEEVWNQGRSEAIDELMTTNAPIYGIAGGDAVIHGPEGFRPGWQALRGAFPDINITIEDAISQGETVAARWTARMTHTGDHLGPPTGKSITITGMVFVRVRDGKLIEGWNNWDMMGLMHAIGQAQHAQFQL